jgi:hypothetical protein
VPFAFDNDVTVDRDAYMFTRPLFQGSSPTVEYSSTTLKGHRFVATSGKLTTVNTDQQARVNRRVQIEGQDGNAEWELLFCEVEATPTKSKCPTDTCEALTNEARSLPFGRCSENGCRC